MSVLKNFIGAKASRGIHIETAGHRRLDLGIGKPCLVASPHLGDGLVGRKPEVSVESPERPQQPSVQGPEDRAAARARAGIHQRTDRSRERSGGSGGGPGERPAEPPGQTPTAGAARWSIGARGDAQGCAPAATHACVRALARVNEQRIAQARPSNPALAARRRAGQSGPHFTADAR
jgi:hypothetical protein